MSCRQIAWKIIELGDLLDRDRGRAGWIACVSLGNAPVIESEYPDDDFDQVLGDMDETVVTAVGLNAMTSLPASHDFVFVVLQFNAESRVELGDGPRNNNRAPRSMGFHNG